MLMDDHVNKTPTAGPYRSAILALVVAAALSAAACGRSKHPATADSSFVSVANAICARAVARHDGHPFPVPDFNPLHASDARCASGPARQPAVPGHARRRDCPQLPGNGRACVSVSFLAR